MRLLVLHWWRRCPAGWRLFQPRRVGIKDFLHEEKNGLVISPRAEGDLVQKLQRLLDEPALRARLGAAARETVLEHFTTEVVAERYERLFNSVARA